MKALVITVPREKWPAAMSNHWHIVDSHISRHLVGAVQIQYAECDVEEYEWKWDSECPTCRGCGESLVRRGAQ